MIYNYKKDFLVQLTKELNITKMEDWYGVKVAQIVKYGGGGLLFKKYGSSPFKMITSLIPEHNWDSSRFSNRKHSWDSIHSQRALLDDISKKLNIQKKEDWYTITQAQIIDKGGGGLLKGRYKGSVMKMVTAIFPEHPWNLFNFSKWTGKWDDIELQREFIVDLAKELKITKMEDWYSVTTIQIHNHGGASLLKHYRSSPSNMLTSLFPQHKWDLLLFDQVPKYK
eukprot:TRINITY_DN4772_c0_g1_i7.p2 TRINITY_DN4772_c0_g1~~TRINITY_DN4772_c0_g1_i7.p2  ORF type:complete len:225 (+),score=35.19 TRINITY_DN4772_c0_g1_i7:705-1379(+)